MPIDSFIGVNKIPSPGVPKILIPTTAGTGSEVTNSSVISLPQEEIKSSIVSPYLFADTAIIDPEMTVSMPPLVTASSGIDALSHAIGAMISIESNPLTDALAIKAGGIRNELV